MTNLQPTPKEVIRESYISMALDRSGGKMKKINNKELPKGHPLRNVKESHSKFAGKGAHNTTLIKTGICDSCKKEAELGIYNGELWCNDCVNAEEHGEKADN